MTQTKYIFFKLAIAPAFGYMRKKFILKKAVFILEKVLKLLQKKSPDFKNRVVPPDNFSKGCMPNRKFHPAKI